MTICLLNNLHFFLSEVRSPVSDYISKHKWVLFVALVQMAISAYGRLFSQKLITMNTVCLTALRRSLSILIINIIVYLNIIVCLNTSLVKLGCRNNNSPPVDMTFAPYLSIFP